MTKSGSSGTTEEVLRPQARVLDAIVGQERVERLLRASVAAPVHAYLFVGPQGTGRREAALAFAAALICRYGGCGACESCVEAVAGRHPDVVVVERAGASISVEQAREVARLSIRTPRAAGRQVLVLVDFHLVTAAAPALLKTVEEPPDTTVVIMIADGIPPEFVTIASRCVRVDFDPLSEESIVTVLEREGIERDHGEIVAKAAQGRLDRAKLLARDPGFAARLTAWRGVPGRLDGTGATAALLALELLSSASEPVEIVKVRQSEELEVLAAEAEQAGDRQISASEMIEERHRRERRRVRTDELRAGLAALADAYRARLLGGLPLTGASVPLRAIDVVNEAAERLTRNPNELLLLEWLLLRLESLS
ncbi:MAG: ATP-binding protein [Acidimicrobiales bacterium]